MPQGPRVKAPAQSGIRIALGQNLERSRFIGKFRASWLSSPDFNQEMVVRSQDVSPGPAAMSAAGAAAVGRPERPCGLCVRLTRCPVQLSYRAREIFGKFLSSKATTPVNIDSQAQLADDILSAPHRHVQGAAAPGDGGGCWRGGGPGCAPRSQPPAASGVAPSPHWAPGRRARVQQGLEQEDPSPRPCLLAPLCTHLRDHRFIDFDIHRAPRCLGLFSFRTSR